MFGSETEFPQTNFCHSGEVCHLLFHTGGFAANAGTRTIFFVLTEMSRVEFPPLCSVHSILESAKDTYLFRLLQTLISARDSFLELDGTRKPANAATPALKQSCVFILFD